MRFLKKALCLILAVVMVLGLGTISSVSADFNDKDKVSEEYREAVDVLETVGVLKGDGKGNLLKLEASGDQLLEILVDADLRKSISVEKYYLVVLLTRHSKDFLR